MLQIPRRKGARRLFYLGVVLVLLVIIGGLGFAVYGIGNVIKNTGSTSQPERFTENERGKQKGGEDLLEIATDMFIGSVVPDKKYIQFTGSEFRDFYDAYEYPFVQPINEHPEITGNTAADLHIQNLAENRGYKLRGEADTDRLRQVLGQQLQPESREAFLTLQETAKDEIELDIILVSGYRSVARQREIFVGSIDELDVEEITTGMHDESIDAILETRSVPGYSKHHTGYTIDVGCGNYILDESVAESGCFKWLSANNYENAKRFGFLPSYPEGAGKQGPYPEPWEYVWVGEDVVLASQYQ